VIGLSVLVIGPMFTSLPLNIYFTTPKTWTYLGNALIFPVQFQLPGVFEGTPHGPTVNGSLWTLPIEVTMYGLLFVAFRIGAIQKSYVIWIPVAFFCALVIGQTHWGLGWENRGGNFLISVPLFNFLVFGVFFFTGSVYFFYKDSLKPNSILALAALGVFVSTFRSPLGFAGAIVAIPYLTHYIAHISVPLWRATNPIGDISYGVYIYAFPIQQCVFVTCSAFLGFFEMTVLSLLLATGLGWLSWRHIERPALQWKTFVGKGSLKEGKYAVSSPASSKTHLNSPASPSPSAAFETRG